MDIQHLVDRLEDLIDDGRHIFGTKFTIIDEERALEIIDQMRISIPEEIEKAARVIAQRDRILAEAHEEAARVIQQTKERAESLIDQDSIVQAAQARAEEIRQRAIAEAARITSGADQYALDVLTRLEQQLVRDLNQVRNGIAHVQSAEASMPTVAELPLPPVHVPRPVEQQYVDVERDDDQRTRSS